MERKETEVSKQPAHRGKSDIYSELKTPPLTRDPRLLIAAADTFDIEVKAMFHRGAGGGDLERSRIKSFILKQENHVLDFGELYCSVSSPRVEASDYSSSYLFHAESKLTWHFHGSGSVREIIGSSSSKGGILRFVTAPRLQWETSEAFFQNYESVLKSVVEIFISPDTQFALKFDGGVPHQFEDISAFSSHPDDRKGASSKQTDSLAKNEANITTFTTCLCPSVIASLDESQDARTFKSKFLLTPMDYLES